MDDGKVGGKRLAEALERRMEFERLFGIKEVYVSAKRRAGPSNPATKLTTPRQGDGPEPQAAAPSGKSPVDAAGARPRSDRAAPVEAEPKKPDSGETGLKKAGPAEFVIEDAPGASTEELSLFPEADGEGVPHVSTATGTNAERLAELARAAGCCTRCRLAETRTNVVFGEGDPEAELVFVGEAPGADEDATGRPFVGRAGKLLTKIIQGMGLRREEVYICNVLKCRPPGNRTPAPEEVMHCSPFLHEQLGVMRPKVVCALGGPATKELLGMKEGITRLRGRFFRYRGIPLMPTFHPAYLLRNMKEKTKVWEDVKKIMAFLGRPVE